MCPVGKSLGFLLGLNFFIIVFGWVHNTRLYMHMYAEEIIAGGRLPGFNGINRDKSKTDLKRFPLCVFILLHHSFIT